MRKFVLALLILIPSRGISQIYFEYPSFEGILPPCVGCNPIGWIQGDLPPDIGPAPGYTILIPIDSIQNCPTYPDDIQSHSPKP